jgi:hypothetical protein
MPCEIPPTGANPRCEAGADGELGPKQGSGQAPGSTQCRPLRGAELDPTHASVQTQGSVQAQGYPRETIGNQRQAGSLPEVTAARNDESPAPGKRHQSRRRQRGIVR